MKGREITINDDTVLKYIGSVHEVREFYCLNGSKQKKLIIPYGLIEANTIELILSDINKPIINHVLKNHSIKSISTTVKNPIFAGESYKEFYHHIENNITVSINKENDIKKNGTEKADISIIINFSPIDNLENTIKVNKEGTSNSYFLIGGAKSNVQDILEYKQLLSYNEDVIKDGIPFAYPLSISSGVMVRQCFANKDFSDYFEQNKKTMHYIFESVSTAIDKAYYNVKSGDLIGFFSKIEEGTSFSGYRKINFSTEAFNKNDRIYTREVTISAFPKTELLRR